ncbi:helix-turn-helix transcriptional regulator [Pseudoflavonifractor phocaeensis]|nr:helix-turn-helix transcriptional regulator [Pseudoflavonifractor phocaeensis]
MKLERVRMLRLEHRYTQKEIAKYLNITQNTYSRYETGISDFPIDALVLLARLYQVSMDYLLGQTAIKTPYPLPKNAQNKFLHSFTHRSIFQKNAL